MEIKEEKKKSARGGSRIGAGRKPRADAEKLVQRPIRLYPNEWEQLEKLGSALNLSALQAAAEILRRHLQRR